MPFFFAKSSSIPSSSTFYSLLVQYAVPKKISVLPGSEKDSRSRKPNEEAYVGCCDYKCNLWARRHIEEVANVRNRSRVHGQTLQKLIPKEESAGMIGTCDRQRVPFPGHTSWQYSSMVPEIASFLSINFKSASVLCLRLTISSPNTSLERWCHEKFRTYWDEVLYYDDWE